MRLNAFIANATGMSRRAADRVIADARAEVNKNLAQAGYIVQPDDQVTLDGKLLQGIKLVTIMLNKPVGYVVSRAGQGSKTVYDLLPSNLQHLKPVGRLDKDSSGLLLLTNDGQLANRLTHPRFEKEKTYEVQIDQPLRIEDYAQITDTGVDIGDDRLSQFGLQAKSNTQKAKRVGPMPPNYFLPFTFCWQATLAEGRNRQIRRTFAALGYKVTRLHRTQFGEYKLGKLDLGQYASI